MCAFIIAEVRERLRDVEHLETIQKSASLSRGGGLILSKYGNHFGILRWEFSQDVESDAADKYVHENS